MVEALTFNPPSTLEAEGGRGRKKEGQDQVQKGREKKEQPDH